MLDRRRACRPEDACAASTDTFAGACSTRQERLAARRGHAAHLSPHKCSCCMPRLGSLHTIACGNVSSWTVGPEQDTLSSSVRQSAVARTWPPTAVTAAECNVVCSGDQARSQRLLIVLTGLMSSLPWGLGSGAVSCCWRECIRLPSQDDLPGNRDGCMPSPGIASWNLGRSSVILAAA